MHTRTRQLTPWTLFALLMAGCLYPGLPPMRLDTDSRAFRSPVLNGAKNAPSIADLVAGRAALIVFHSNRRDAWEFSRSANSVRRLARELGAHTDFIVVEIAIRASSHEQDASEAPPIVPENWIRVEVSPDDPIASPVSEFYSGFAAYFAMPDAPAERITMYELDDSEIGPLADLAMGFPVDLFDRRWTVDEFQRLYAGVAHIEIEHDGALVARYHNPATNHDVVASFARTRREVLPLSEYTGHDETPRRHTRIYTDPGTVCISGVDSTFQRRAIAKIAPAIASELEGSTSTTLVTVESAYLHETDHALRYHRFNTHEYLEYPNTVCFNTRPGTYRLSLLLVTVQGPRRVAEVDTSIVIEIGAHDKARVDLHEHIRRALESGPE